MRGVQKCTCAGASLRGRYSAPLCCIKLDTATDPCAGSGYILAYMFDVLMQIYESYGYTTRDAVASIVENNLYGLDIDDRAAQLAYFAVMMKARQYDRYAEIEEDIHMSRETALRELLPLVQVAEALAQKYAVVTNPPYMGGSGVSAKLSDYVKKNYPDSKSDLFAVFVEKCGQMHVWPLLSGCG